MILATDAASLNLFRAVLICPVDIPNLHFQEAVMDLFKLSSQVEQYVIDLRREFHQNPEISFQEVRTTTRIKEELDKVGIPYETVGSGNVVALFDTGRPGKTLAIRADIDALPMEENDKSRPYCSKVPGAMHSCGHDGHTAMLLGTAKVLSQIKDDLTGKIYLCFQVAEEVGGGAGEIVAYLKEKGGVDCVIGTHLDGGSDAGVIHLPDGPLWRAHTSMKSMSKASAAMAPVPTERSTPSSPPAISCSKSPASPHSITIPLTPAS